MKKLFILLTIIWTGIYAQSTKDNSNSIKLLKCSTCHSCEIPTKENPCLISCPREHMIMKHSPEEGPNVITMDEMKEISDLYTPVIFSHKLHAEMAGMSSGCSMCHHYNPPGKVIACSNCHEVSRQRTDISKPDLKGAYHRQCINCHGTWVGSINCTDCHALNEEASKQKPAAEKKTSGRVHPEIVEPTRLVYETDFDDGKIVTFYHNEHTDLYGFDCSDCHQNEACATCHQTETAKKAATFEDKHEFCSQCHAVDDDCEHCHKNKIMEPFNHKQRTGFALGKYHNKLSCTQCHGSGRKFAHLNSKCVSCHKGWEVGKFNHAVTGLTLSENHIEADCEMCHIGMQFSQKPSCDNCHEEDITYPDYAPGEFK